MILGQEAQQFTCLHLDDCIVYNRPFEPGMTEGKTEEEIVKMEMEAHYQNLRHVLDKLLKRGALLSIKKLSLFATEMRYLGAEISTLDGSIRIAEERRDHFMKMKIPESKVQMQKFLGILNFVSPHISGLATLSAPLFASINQTPFTLNEVQVKCYEAIRDQCINAPKLSLLMHDRPLYLVTDASGVAAGACLFQIAGEQRLIIRYFSQIFSECQRRSLASIAKECLAILIGIQQSKRYSQFLPLTVITDMRAIISVMKNDDQDSPITRMCIKMLENRCLSFKLIWQRSDTPEIQCADALSRLPYLLPFSLTRERYEKAGLNIELADIPDEWRLKPEISAQEVSEYLLQVERDKRRAKGLQSEVGRRKKKVTIDIDAGNEKAETERLLSADYVESAASVCESVKSLPQGSSFNAESFKHIHETFGVEAHCLAVESANKLNIQNEEHHLPFTVDRVINDQLANPETREIIKFLDGLKPSQYPDKYKQYMLIDDCMLALKPRKYWNETRPSRIKSARIIVSKKFALELLAVLHLQLCHAGISSLLHVFTRYYSVPNASGLTQLICTNCRSCQLYRVTRKGVSRGSPLRGTRPGQVYAIDHARFKPITDKGKHYEHCLLVTDTYSNFQMSKLVSSKSAKATIAALEEIFATHGAPEVICSDQAKELCLNASVQSFLKKWGVRGHVIMAYSPTGNAYAESAVSLLKSVTYLQSEAFAIPWCQSFYPAIMQINSLPRRRVNPKTKKVMYISPFELHHGYTGLDHFQIRAKEFQLTDGQINKLRTRVQKFNNALIKAERNEQEARDRLAKEHLKENMYCLVKHLPLTRHQVYSRHLHKILHLYRRKVVVLNLTTKVVSTVHRRLVKEYKNSEELVDLPSYLKPVFGYYMTKDEIESKNPPVLAFGLQEHQGQRGMRKQGKPLAVPEANLDDEANGSGSLSDSDDSSQQRVVHVARAAQKPQPKEEGRHETSTMQNHKNKVHKAKAARAPKANSNASSRIKEWAQKARNALSKTLRSKVSSSVSSK
jgi:hypothetical protein